MITTRIFVAFGANESSDVGPPLETLREAAAMLSASGARVAALARWRRSAAVPAGAGPDFVNGAARIETDLPPVRLLALLHEIERALGRERGAQNGGARWAARPCDLDLIAYGDLVLPDEATVRGLMALGASAADEPVPEELILPHPRLHDRAFVLGPLAEIAPGWRHPLTGRTAAKMLADLPHGSRADMELIDD